MKKVLAGAMAAGLVLAAMPASAEEKPLKISAPGAVKGTTQVAIGAFNVGFVFESVDNGKATGGLIGAFGGTTRAKSLLTGVTPEQMQAITDAAYADFVRQLTAAGYTVVPSAPMFADPGFAKIKLQAAPLDQKIALDPKGKSNGKATYYKPSQLPGMLMMAGDVTGSGMFAGFGQMGMAMNNYHVATYAQKARHGVIAATYVIDFSQLKRPGAFSFGGLQVNSGMAVIDDYSKVTVVAPNGKSTIITVNTPVAVEGDFAMRDDTTKDAGLQKVANVAGGVAAVFGMGGMMMGKSKTFTFTAKPAYQEGAVKAASLANQRIVGQLAALK